MGVSLPARYSSPGSLSDAEALARNLGIHYEVLPIETVFQSVEKQLSKVFAGTQPNAAEENIQSRLRGVTLMALSNKFGALVLTTGNKSEMAVGYCTLYGDMCGALAPLADVFKMDVYKISRWVNREREMIPRASLTKPPSAELRPDQKDQDSLPPYEVLDRILDAYVVQNLGKPEIIARGFDAAIVNDVINKITFSEYKRRQAAPGLKVSPRAFTAMVLPARSTEKTPGWRVLFCTPLNCGTAGLFTGSLGASPVSTGSLLVRFQRTQCPDVSSLRRRLPDCLSTETWLPWPRSKSVEPVAMALVQGGTKVTTGNGAASLASFALPSSVLPPSSNALLPSSAKLCVSSLASCMLVGGAPVSSPAAPSEPSPVVTSAPASLPGPASLPPSGCHTSAAWPPSGAVESPCASGARPSSRASVDASASASASLPCVESNRAIGRARIVAAAAGCPADDDPPSRARASGRTGRNQERGERGGPQTSCRKSSSSPHASQDSRRTPLALLSKSSRPSTTSDVRSAILIASTARINCD